MKNKRTEIETSTEASFCQPPIMASTSSVKVLNLYAGIGGNRKLWQNVEVTTVEYNDKIAAIYKDNFPNDKVIIGDAHEYLLKHYKEFDFIWSSPPCPTHSGTNHFFKCTRSNSLS